MHRLGVKLHNTRWLLFSGAACAVIWLVWTLALAGADTRVDPLVRNIAGDTTATLPLLIILEDQPQRNILADVERTSNPRLQMAQTRYKELAVQPLVPEAELRAASEDRDAIVLETRRRAAAQIEAAIGLQQAAMENWLLGLGASNVRRYKAINMLRAEIPALGLTALETRVGISEILSLDRRFGGEGVTRFLDVLDEGLFQSAATIFTTGTLTLDRNPRLSQALDRIAALYGVEFVRPAWNIQWPFVAAAPPGTTGAKKFCVGTVVAVTPDPNGSCGSATAGLVKKGTQCASPVRSRNRKARQMSAQLNTTAPFGVAWCPDCVRSAWQLAVK